MKWLANGGIESEGCEARGGVAHPTGWNYDGTITQIYYTNTAYGNSMVGILIILFLIHIKFFSTL